MSAGSMTSAPCDFIASIAVSISGRRPVAVARSFRGAEHADPRAPQPVLLQERGVVAPRAVRRRPWSPRSSRIDAGDRAEQGRRVGDERAIGPAVSWLCAIGMTPARLIRPTVGLIPTTRSRTTGETIEPSVSVPTRRGAAVGRDGGRRAGAGAATGCGRARTGCGSGRRGRSSRWTNGWSGSWPTRSGSSCRAAPRRPRAAAPRRRVLRAGRPSSASEPAVVVIRSAVSMLSFTGSGCRAAARAAPCAFRSASSASAMASASGFGLDHLPQARALPGRSPPAAAGNVRPARARCTCPRSSPPARCDGDLVELRRRGCVLRRRTGHRTLPRPRRLRSGRDMPGRHGHGSADQRGLEDLTPAGGGVPHGRNPDRREGGRQTSLAFVRPFAVQALTRIDGGTGTRAQARTTNADERERNAGQLPLGPAPQRRYTGEMETRVRRRLRRGRCRRRRQLTCTRARRRAERRDDAEFREYDPRWLQVHRAPPMRDVPYLPSDEPIVEAMLDLARSGRTTWSTTWAAATAGSSSRRPGAGRGRSGWTSTCCGSANPSTTPDAPG